MGKIHIGISGWRYVSWRGKFYPPGKGDVYCYFDNDIKVHAPYDAQRLIAALS